MAARWGSWASARRSRNRQALIYAAPVTPSGYGRAGGRRRRRYANEYAAIKHAPNAFIKNERETGNWRLSVLAARVGLGCDPHGQGEKRNQRVMNHEQSTSLSRKHHPENLGGE